MIRNRSSSVLMFGCSDPVLVEVFLDPRICGISSGFRYRVIVNKFACVKAVHARQIS